MTRTFSRRRGRPSPAARRIGVALAAVACAALPTLGAGTPSAAAATQDPLDTPSARTISGTGEFSALSVTVGQTENLGNQGVKVSWQWTDADPGRHATISDTEFRANFMTIFQCWGDPATGPTREQCQYGGRFQQFGGGGDNASAPRNTGGGYMYSRAVSVLEEFSQPLPDPTDPRELTDPAGYPPLTGVPAGQAKGQVPLWSAPTAAHPQGERITPPQETSDTSQAFDLWGTNEVTTARTDGGGHGQVLFETHTAVESNFLQCGARIGVDQAGMPVGRPCFLVVVPRSTIDVDGVDVTTRPPSRAYLKGSPLSLSAWEHRIVFPLGFAPVKEPCAIGGVERPIVGHESLMRAVSSWQGPLCANGQGFFYASVTDDIARDAVVSDFPKLSVVTDPLSSGALPLEKGFAVYAPVAVSGVSIALFIEREYNSASDPAQLPFNGSRVERIRLTPRLVAKLLTQSYSQSLWVTNGGAPQLRDAPASLIDDPEFVQINQGFIGSMSIADIRNNRDTLAKLNVTAEGSDAVQLVWSWLLADAKARAFLAGTPDEFGMRINPAYKGVEHYQQGQQVLAEVPRLDSSCTDVPVGNADPSEPPRKVCVLDVAPYAASFEQSAALAARGQPSGSSAWVLDNGVLKMPRPAPQLVGKRAVLSLTDTPSATARGLVSAELPNADGTFVAPTTEAMGTALGQAIPGAVPGVQRIDPSRVTGGGYPLTRIEYAVTNPVILDTAAREAYAGFLEVVSTKGQVQGTMPGNLPYGYVPLTDALKAQATAGATAIRTATKPVLPAAAPTPSGATAPVASSGDGVDLGLASAASNDPLPEATGQAPAVSQPKPSVLDKVARVFARLTPFGSGSGLLLPALALAGSGCGLSSFVLIRTGRGDDAS